MLMLIISLQPRKDIFLLKCAIQVARICLEREKEFVSLLSVLLRQAFEAEASGVSPDGLVPNCLVPDSCIS